MGTIPELIRQAVKPTYENKERHKSVIPKVNKLFPTEAGSQKTRKGEWLIRLRKTRSPTRFLDSGETGPANGFCAIYHKDSIPRLVVTGETADRKLISRSLKNLTGKTLEQRAILSRPPRGLTSENGLKFGFNRGFWFMFLLTFFIVCDLFIIPQYHEAISKGLSISFQTEGSAGPDLSGYRSRLYPILLSIFGEEYIHLTYSFYTLVAFFTLPVLIVSVWGEIAGKRSDKTRVKSLPKEALEFQYGFQALKSIEKEFDRNHNEEKKVKLYEELTALGLRTDRENFQRIFDDLTS